MSSAQIIDKRSYEASSSLIMNVAAEKITEVLIGRGVLGQHAHSMHELDAIVQESIPKDALDRFIAFFTRSNRRAVLIE